MAKTKNYPEIKKFEADLDLCMKCGFCAYWCPVYKEEKIESSVARGKNQMIRGLIKGDLEYTKEYEERLNKCTLCGTCSANCPARVQIPPVIVAARADVAKHRGVGFPYNIIYRWILPKRLLFGFVMRCASGFQNIFFPRTTGTVRHLPVFLSALGKGRHIPQISSKFLRQIIPEVSKPTSGKTIMKAGYFAGCINEYVFPELGKKIVDFLNRNDVEVVTPRGQGCCGAPVFLGSGDFATGKKMADANVKAFEGLDYVIVSCATCGSAMKDYVKFLADTPERKEAYTKFAGKIKDISEFLVDVLKLPASAYKTSAEFRGKTVTWHDPCHLNRHMGVREQPRKILRSLPDIKFIEMNNADSCCGMAGSFSIHFYELSQKIAGRKMSDIEDTGADIVVTGCPGCEIQLIDSAAKRDKPLKVAHIIELLE